MKNFFKKLFDIHETIGKVFTSFCVVCIIAALIGLITGTTKVLNKEEVVKTNYFINENVNIHSDNYSIKVMEVSSATEITYLDKKYNEQSASGNFVLVTIELMQYEHSTLKSHKIDKDDFKLKDHTGIYVPMNDIMGAIGWDAIDIHFDEKDGGHVMSSTDFSTRKSYSDYNYISKEISPGITMNMTLIFEFDSAINPLSELIVMEVDFYVGSSDYKQGSDIILLERPQNLK